MEKEVVRVWFCNRRQKEKRIYCPVASLSVKSHNYNSRMVSCCQHRCLPLDPELGFFKALEDPYTRMVKVNKMNEGLHLFNWAGDEPEGGFSSSRAFGFISSLCCFRPQQRDPTAPWLQAEASEPSSHSYSIFGCCLPAIPGLFGDVLLPFPSSFFKFLSEQYQPRSFAQHPVGHLVLADVSDQPGLLQHGRVSVAVA